MRMRTGSSCPFCTKKYMDRTRAWNSYWNALVVTSTWQSFYMNKERFYCVSNVKTKGCMLYSKETWISLQSGIRSLPGRALCMTAGAEAVFLHLFRVVLKKYSNWGVLMAVFCCFQYIICNIQMLICIRSIKPSSFRPHLVVMPSIQYRYSNLLNSTVFSVIFEQEWNLLQFFADSANYSFIKTIDCIEALEEGPNRRGNKLERGG